MTNSTKITTILCIFLLIFAILIWPTIYRYDIIQVFDNKLLQRTNRITGESTITSTLNNTNLESIRLPLDAIAKIEGTASVGYANTFTCELYNGSDWIITSLVLKLDLFEIDGKLRWSRYYEHPLRIGTFSSGSSTISITQGLNYGSFNWDIFEAYGYMSDKE